MGSVVDSDILVAELVRHQRRIYIFIGSLLPNMNFSPELFS